MVCGGQFKVVDSATSGSAWYGREAANLMLPFTGFLCKDLLLTVFSTLDVDLCNRLGLIAKPMPTQTQGCPFTFYRLTPVSKPVSKRLVLGIMGRQDETYEHVNP